AWGVSPWDGDENDDLAAERRHLETWRNVAASAAKRPFPYSVMGLTPQAISFRRSAAELTGCT
ncbi:MAG: hypothetical protein ABSG53_14625, partial [Thermoguttaceae bacterium]